MYICVALAVWPHTFSSSTSEIFAISYYYALAVTVRGARKLNSTVTASLTSDQLEMGA